MIITKINPLKLGQALIKLGRKVSSRHSLLDMVILLAIAESNKSRKELFDLVSDKTVISQSITEAPIKRLVELSFIERIDIAKFDKKNGHPTHEFKLTIKGKKFLESFYY